MATATIGFETMAGGWGAAALTARASPFQFAEIQAVKVLTLRCSDSRASSMAVALSFSPPASGAAGGQRVSRRKSPRASLGEFGVLGGEAAEEESRFFGAGAEDGDVPLDDSVFEQSFTSVRRVKKVPGARVRGVPIPRSTLVPDDWKAVQAYQERGKKERKIERKEVELEWARRMAAQRRAARAVGSGGGAREAPLDGGSVALESGHDVVVEEVGGDENWTDSDGEEDERRLPSSGRAQPKDVRADLEFSSFEDIAQSLRDNDLESQGVEDAQIEVERNSEEESGARRRSTVALTPEEKALLKAKTLDFARISSTCWSPLQTFAAAGQVYLAAELLRKGGVDVDAVDGDGLTALQRAVQAGRKTMVRMLLKAGANCGVVDGAGATLLHYSARLGNEDICKLLLRNGADINAADADGWTALHVAVQSGRVELVKALVYRGADLTLKTGDGCTALDLALAFGGCFNFYDTIKFIKKRMVFDVDSRPQTETADHSM